jgi:hypothetical protein
MLKFLYVARISNFHIFLADLSHDFKHIIFSCQDALLRLRYMIGKLQMSSFQNNLKATKFYR